MWFYYCAINGILAKEMEESRRKIGTENAHQIDPDRGSAFDEFFLFRGGFYAVFKLLHVPIALCYFPLRLKAFLQLLRILRFVFSFRFSLLCFPTQCFTDNCAFRHARLAFFPRSLPIRKDEKQEA